MQTFACGIDSFSMVFNNGWCITLWSNRSLGVSEPIFSMANVALTNPKGEQVPPSVINIISSNNLYTTDEVAKIICAVSKL